MTNNKNFTFHADETVKIYLEDDKTETGGKAYCDETLEHFMIELQLPYQTTTLEKINKALKKCGIKTLKVEEHKGECGSYIVVNKNTILIRKDYDSNSRRFYFKSVKNFRKNEDLPCYSEEESEIDEFHTGKEMIELANGNHHIAETLIIQIEGRNPQNQYEQWQAEGEIDYLLKTYENEKTN